jgi:hypothetical protein
MKNARITMPQPDGTVIITCALTGGIHGKEANPNLPEQPDEIVAQGVAAWRRSSASCTSGCAPKPTR